MEINFLALRQIKTGYGLPYYTDRCHEPAGYNRKNEILRVRRYKSYERMLHIDLGQAKNTKTCFYAFVREYS